MISLKSLIEAIVPDKSEFERAAKESEYGVISVILDKSGNVRIDDYSFDRNLTKARVDLGFTENRIRVFKNNLHGNKIDPSVQQLISALVKNKVVDSSWKVEFGDDEGFYKKGEYVYRRGEYENLPPNFWSRKSRVDLGENLKLYHGTSELELPDIKRYGLRPLGFKTTEPGHASRLRIEENKDFIYLAGTFVDAFKFAKERARSNMLKVDATQYRWVEHHEWERWFIKPVVFLVTIPDFTKLRSDDDRLLSMIKSKASEIWDKLTPEEKEYQQKTSSQWFSQRGLKYTPDQISDYLWVISDNGFNMVMPHINKEEWKNWRASLKSHNQVAYQGQIPQKFLQTIDLERVTKKRR